MTTGGARPHRGARRRACRLPPAASSTAEAPSRSANADAPSETPTNPARTLRGENARKRSSLDTTSWMPATQVSSSACRSSSDSDSSPRLVWSDSTATPIPSRSRARIRATTRDLRGRSGSGRPGREARRRRGNGGIVRSRRAATNGSGQDAGGRRTSSCGRGQRSNIGGELFERQRHLLVRLEPGERARGRSRARAAAPVPRRRDRAEVDRLRGDRQLDGRGREHRGRASPRPAARRATTGAVRSSTPDSCIVDARLNDTGCARSAPPPRSPAPRRRARRGRPATSPRSRRAPSLSPLKRGLRSLSCPLDRRREHGSECDAEEVERRRERLRVEVPDRDEPLLVEHHERVAWCAFSSIASCSSTKRSESRVAPCTCGTHAERERILEEARGIGTPTGCCPRAARASRVSVSPIPGYGRAAPTVAVQRPDVPPERLEVECRGGVDPVEERARVGDARGRPVRSRRRCLTRSATASPASSSSSSTRRGRGRRSARDRPARPCRATARRARPPSLSVSISASAISGRAPWCPDATPFASRRSDARTTSVGSRRAEPDEMAEDRRAVERPRLPGVHGRVAAHSDAGRDRHTCVSRPARRAPRRRGAPHARQGLLGQSDGLSRACHPHDLVEREALSAEARRSCADSRDPTRLRSVCRPQSCPERHASHAPRSTTSCAATTYAAAVRDAARSPTRATGPRTARPCRSRRRRDGGDGRRRHVPARTARRRRRGPPAGRARARPGRRAPGRRSRSRPARRVRGRGRGAPVPRGSSPARRGARRRASAHRHCVRSLARSRESARSLQVIVDNDTRSQGRATVSRGERPALALLASLVLCRLRIRRRSDGRSSRGRVPRSTRSPAAAEQIGGRLALRSST